MPASDHPSHQKKQNQKNTEVDEHINESNRLAGLFWRLLKREQRHKIATRLTARELERLNQAFDDWRKGSPDLRRRTSLNLHAILKSGQPAWPAMLAVAGFMVCVCTFILHAILIPDLAPRLQIELFGTLLMGVLAPLLFYFLSRPRRRMLMQPPFRLDWVALSFLSYLAGLWLMFHINVLDGNTSKLAGNAFSLSILFIAVASAPLLEEIVFRELLPSLFGRDPYYLGQTISAFVFAALHMTGTGGMSPKDRIAMFTLYLIASGLFAALRIMTGSLLYGFIVHAAINCMTLVLLL